MKKTAYFIVLSVIVAGIVSTLGYAIYQNQVSADTDIDSNNSDSNTGYTVTDTGAYTGGVVGTTTSDNSIVDESTGGSTGSTAGGASGTSTNSSTNSSGNSSSSTSGNVSDILPSNAGKLSNTSIDSLINKIIKTLFYGSQIIFIIILLYGGIEYLTSMGDEAKMTTARKTIFAALIGIVIIYSVWAIATFVINAISG